MDGQIAKVTAYRADSEDGPETSVDLAAEIDGGESDTDDVDHFSACGDDSPPLPGDWALITPLDADDAEESNACGAYSDDLPRVAEPGEKRIYARSPDGELVSEIHMTGNGVVTIAQTNGATVEITAGGDVNVTTTGDIKLSGASVSLAEGTPLGEFLISLHTALAGWTPVLNDGGTALKTLLAADFLTKPPPSP